MGLSKLLISLLVFFISSISVAKNQQVYFEPKLVELKGIIRLLKFPGPPNYENVKNGDADETGPYILLDSPIDILLIPKLSSDINIPEKNVALLQLIISNENDWKKIEENNYVQITGVLIHAFTAHHHTRALLRVNKIKVITKKEKTNINLHVTPEDQKFLDHEYLQN